jgi:protein-export membrane protein SecD/preprotein translocase SecF subunit
LRRRIDPQNVKEFRIQPLGESRILIQVPEATQAEVEQLKDGITKMGRLEFRLGLPPGDSKFQEKYERAMKGESVEGYKKVYLENDPEQQFYLLEDGPPAITGEYLDQVNVTRDQRGRLAIGFRFNARGRRQFASITERNRGKVLGILLDGVLKSAPVIRSRIEGQGIIEGDFTQEEIDNLITVLRAGSLPMNVKLLQETTVGPQLGQDSIRKGLMSLAVAGIVVLTFIGFYYLTCGLVADGALILNLVFLTGVLGLLGAALTLPGLAGILLTVGMAVDANVLIFERIREETGAGKTPQVALRNGYDKAYSTIIDANVTTLLTAIILYMIGTGPVQGFAVTLSAGIVLSMFTSLFVTRLALETMLDKKYITKFRMFSIVGQPGIRYSRYRKLAFIVSAVVLVGGMVAFFGRGSELYDVDFTGGTLVQLSFDKPVSTSRVREILADGGYADAQVQGIRSSASGDGKTTDFRIRFKGIGTEHLKATLKPRISAPLERKGLIGEDGIRISSDGQSLRIRLTEEITELQLREILAGEDGSPYRLDPIKTIAPAGKPVSTIYTLIFAPSVPALDKNALLLKMTQVFDRAGVKGLEINIDLEAIQYSEENDTSYRMLRTDRNIPWAALAVELQNLNLDGLDVTPTESPTNEFRVSGPEVELKKIVPGKLIVPDVTIDENSVTATLKQPLREADIQAYLSKAGLDSIVVHSPEVRIREFVLTIGQEAIRNKITKLFEKLETKTKAPVLQAITLEERGGEYQTVKMKLPKAMSRSEIEYYLENAGLRIIPGETIVSELGPNTTTRTITLRLPAENMETLKEDIIAAFQETSPVKQIQSIGAVVAEEMQGRALLAVICASLVIVFYLALRFHALKFGVAAVIALIHDVGITAGIVALADASGIAGDIKINLPMLAAFLTILGYSVNDTVVVFDRIRENTVEKGHTKVTADIIDLSINQVLSRTVLTSLTTLAVVLALYILGGPALQGLAFTLIIGIVIGTYSSVFIASPLLLDWQKLVTIVKLFFKVVFLPVRAPFIVLRKLK